MSKFKLEFRLKQHTPIIHFQSEQSGATLRATELKPKLDRFLIEYAFENNKALYEKFLIDKDKGALDYKVKIIKKKISDDKVDLNGLPDDRLFMGNMGGGDKKQMFHRNYETEVTIFTFNPLLKEIISEHFSNFIFQTNFGGGSSKGFGSFTVEESEVIYPQNSYSFSVGSDKLENVYNSIFYFYKIMKSGINQYDRNSNSVLYAKSLLWLYSNNVLDTTWDKKAMKQNFLPRDLIAQRAKYPNSDILKDEDREAFLYRDLLGLSLDSDWKSYDKTIHKQSDNISRFPSPITFKPVLTDDGYIVYYWAKEISEDMLDKKFTLSEGDNRFTLFTPKEFDIWAYLEFVSEQNMKNHIDSKYHNDDEGIFKTLNSIFNAIKKVEQ